MRGWFGAVTLAYLWGYKTLLSLSPEFDFQFWNELPLQPCNLIAILAILAAATDWQVLKNFCLCAGIPFAMVALLMPVDGFSQVPLFSVNAIGFYGVHGMALVLSVSFATLGGCRSRLRDIPGTAALLVGLGTAVHGVNVLLRATVLGGANYFLYLRPGGQRGAGRPLGAASGAPGLRAAPAAGAHRRVPGDDPARPSGRRAKETELRV